MNTRNMLLAAALALLAVGLLMTISELFSEAPSQPRVAVAVAAQAIEPYTILTQEMVRADGQLTVSDASAQGAWPAEAVLGKMSTARIRPGTRLTGVNLKPIEEVRFVEDLGLEVVSFAAGVDRLVGGKLRPGHLINLYGIGRDPISSETFTELVDARLWVVGVTASGQPVDLATPRPNVVDGTYDELRSGRERSGTMITIAVEPERAFHIIDALGAKDLSAWVTLAASHTAELPATATPEPLAVAPTIDVWATIQYRSTATVVVPDGGYGGMAGR